MNTTTDTPPIATADVLGGTIAITPREATRVSVRGSDLNVNGVDYEVSGSFYLHAETGAWHPRPDYATTYGLGSTAGLYIRRMGGGEPTDAGARAVTEACRDAVQTYGEQNAAALHEADLDYRAAAASERLELAAQLREVADQLVTEAASLGLGGRIITRENDYDGGFRAKSNHVQTRQGAIMPAIVMPNVRVNTVHERDERGIRGIAPAWAATSDEYKRGA